MATPLTPRARAILAAVEREVSARLSDLEGEAASVAPRRVAPFERAAPELLLALELGVAGFSRAQVAAEMGCTEDEPVLDAVFGRGTPPTARLRRAA